MTPHSARHARPAKRSRRGSHQRGSHGHVVLGTLAVAFCAAILVATVMHCTTGTQSTVKETDSLAWRLVHYVQTGWHRMECVDYGKMSREAVAWSADYLSHHRPKVVP
jgi:hypothetical protein